MRTWNENYGFWLSGYYDDFNGARAISDDLNETTELTSSQDHINTHYGNPLTKENILNPRYRFGYVDRARIDHYSASDPNAKITSLENAGYFLWSTTTNNLTHNDGVHNWLTVDGIRTQMGKWEGRSQSFVPDWKSSNRFRYNNLAGTNGYMGFINGHNTQGVYTVPLGMDDPSYGRSLFVHNRAFDSTSRDLSPFCGCPIKYANGVQSFQKLVQCNIGSVFMGYKLGGRAASTAHTSATHLVDEDYTLSQLYPLKSPSKMPFFINDLVMPTTGTHTVINYDSYLKAKGIGDIFTIRLSHMAQGNFTSSSDPTYTLKIGYIATASYTQSNNTWSETTPCITMTFTPTDLGLGGVNQYREWNGSSQTTGITDASKWKDIDVKIDFATQTWKAYLDGASSHFKSGSMGSRPGGGSWVASDLKGWNLDVAVASLGSQGYANIVTLIDRVGLIFPLTDPNVGTANTFTDMTTNKIMDMKYKTQMNSVGTMELTLEDDSNTKTLVPLATETGLTDWSLLMFRDNGDRPIWRGIVESVNISQNSKAQTVDIKIKARDALSLLSRQLPLWEYGQNATTSMGDFVALESSVNVRNEAVQNLRDKMNMGAVRLKFTDENLAFQSTDFDENDNNRMLLNSGHPIQMYIGEDKTGPNEPESEWLGQDASSYKLTDIRFIQYGQQNASPNADYVLVCVSSDCTLQSSDLVTIAGCGNDLDTNYEIQAVESKNTIFMDGSSNKEPHTGGIDITQQSVCTNREFEITKPYKILRLRKASSASADVTNFNNAVTVAKTINKTITVNYADDTALAFQTEDLGGLDQSQRLMSCRTVAAHGLSIGDEVMIGLETTEATGSNKAGWDISGNSDPIFDGNVVRVHGVPSTTEFQFMISCWPRSTNFDSRTSSNNWDVQLSTGKGVTILDMSKFNRGSGYGAADTQLRPVIYKTTMANDATLAKLKYRVAHARWMKDIANSLFFKARFGIISNKCWWRTGDGTWLKNPVMNNLQSTYTGAGLSLTSSWDGLNADVAKGATTVTMDEPGLWYWLKVRGKDGILDFVDTLTGDRDCVLATVSSNPSSTTGYIRSVSHSPSTHANTFQRCFEGPAGLNLWDIVVHEGFDSIQYNGVFQITSIVASTGSYTRYVGMKIEEFSRGTNVGISETCNFTPAVPTALNWNQVVNGPDVDMLMPVVGEIDADGGGQRIEWVNRAGGHTGQNANNHPYNTATGTTKGLLAAGSQGKIYYGNFNLSVKGVTRDWDKDTTQVTLRKIDNAHHDEVTMGYNATTNVLDSTRGAYKHCWVLWSDMRNSGDANADGEFRKNSFGLIKPTSDNYSVSMHLINQRDDLGKPVEYGQLKAGEDFDLWEFDAEKEPFTGASWSAISTGSDKFWASEFANWDDKAGSFIIIDLSRYFNLNTMANGGRAGYKAAGLATFEDYGDFAISATPYLVDNWWLQAIASNKTAGLSGPMTTHPNQYNFINDSTPLTSSVAVGATTIAVNSVSDFTFASVSSPGFGTVLCKKGNETVTYSIRWTGVTNTATAQNLTGVLIEHYPNSHGPEAIRTALKADAAAGVTGSQVALTLNDLSTTDQYDEILVYNTPAALVALKMLMYLNGYVKSQNSGTFFESDKIRFLQSLALTDSWTRTHFLSSITDICNTPISHNQTLTQTDYDADHLGSGLGDTDSFGSVINLQTATTLQSLKKIQDVGGTGTGGNNLPLGWGQGRDNRFELRPAYSINHAFTRSNVKVASLKTNMSGTITNVRVFYNGNTSFCDHPQTNTIPAASRWKILEHPTITLKEEAEAIAKREYQRAQKGNLTVDAQVIRSGTRETLGSLDNHIMLGGARYGYIADPYIKTLAQTTNTVGSDQYELFGLPGMLSWGSRWGGTPISRGIVNAIEGAPDPRVDNFGPTLHDATNATTHMTPLLNESNNPGSYAGHIPAGVIRMGSIGGFQGRIGTSTTKKGFLKLTISSSGANYQVALHRTTSGSSVESAFTGTVTAKSGGPAWHSLADSGEEFTVYVDTGHSDFPTSDGDYWAHFAYTDIVPPSHADPYNGIYSLHNAVQIVHIPKDTPYVSATSGHEMRVAVAINNKSGDFSSIDDVLFDVVFLDYSFATTTGSLPSGSGTYSPTRVPSREGFSKVTVKGNGFYEVTFPSSYGATAGAKMIISVNTDYLRGVLRNRLGLDTTELPPTGGISTVLKNSSALPDSGTADITYPSLDTTNISPFPLGMRNIEEFGSLYDRQKMGAFNAPRVHIVDDVNWVPNTKVTYTDTHMDLTTQEMILKSVTWIQKAQEHEQVTLSLEKDADQYNYDFVRLFNVGGRPGTSGPLPKPKPRPPQNKPHPGFNPFPRKHSEEPPTGSPRPHFTNMGQPESVPDSGTSINELNASIYRTMNGITEVGSDFGSVASSWGIPGQKRPSRTTSTELSIDGFDTVPESGSGNAVLTADGFTLPGIADAETGANGEFHTHTMKVRVPQDAVGDLVEIEAQVSLGAAGSTLGRVTTTVKCIETDKSVSQITSISADTSRTLKNLLSLTPLSGAGTAGNTLEITFERTPGDGTDTAIYAALHVHSVALKTRRATNAHRSSTDTAFRPY